MTWLNVLLLLFLVANSARAESLLPTGRATGLRPPTVVERQEMETGLPAAARVKLNRVAIARINQEREGAGLEPLVRSFSVDFGHEIETGSSGLVWSAGEILPAVVDNSTLPSFPPVADQGDLGSCAAFSAVYYTGTHMLRMARGGSSKSAAPDDKLSPKFAYNFANGGGDYGSWFSSYFDLLVKHGCPFWEDWPYSGRYEDSANYLEWPRESAIYRKALLNRFESSGRIVGINTPAGRAQAKALLANGYVLMFGTDIDGWVGRTLSDDPATALDDAHAEEKVCGEIQTGYSGHAMTIVGYHDQVWSDLNNNGEVDAGEKGAFKIVNSWGTGWGNKGCIWLSYDALNSVSSVAGADHWNRAASPFYYNEVYWLRATEQSVPGLLAEFTVNTYPRSQVRLSLGVSGTSLGGPERLWTPGIAWIETGEWGYAGSSVAADATFVLDLSSLTALGDRKYYLVLNDDQWGTPTTLESFQLTDAEGNRLAGAEAGLPFTINTGARNTAIVFNYAAPKIVAVSSASGTVGQPFVYAVNAEGVLKYSSHAMPAGLQMDTQTGVISGTPAEPGTNKVTIMAHGAGGSAGAVLELAIFPARLGLALNITAPTFLNGALHFRIPSVSNAIPQIEFSTDLVDWTAMGRANSDGSFTAKPTGLRRFYRAVNLR